MTIFVRIGDILLNGAEVPQVVNGGGQQLMTIHQLIGGKRVIDTLGRSDIDIKMSGLFRGIISMERLQYLDYLRINGQQVSFTYSTYNYLVVVKSLEWRLKMVYQFEYDIVLTVVQDLNQPVSFAIPDSFSDVIESAYENALDLATLINAGGVIASLGELGIALQAAANLDALTNSEVANISAAIANSIASVDSAIENISI